MIHKLVYIKNWIKFEKPLSHILTSTLPNTGAFDGKLSSCSDEVLMR